jgi:CRISPR/Cas system-associated exonuclease Cas4 (RecB family)
MSSKLIQFPIKETTFEEIFQELMEIGEVAESEQPEEENFSATCPHCGRPLPLRDDLT